MQTEQSTLTKAGSGHQEGSPLVEEFPDVPWWTSVKFHKKLTQRMERKNNRAVRRLKKARLLTKLSKRRLLPVTMRRALRKRPYRSDFVIEIDELRDLLRDFFEHNTLFND